MAKVNYQFQKLERERAKLAKKEAKKREAERAQPAADAPKGDDASPETNPADA